MTLIGYTIHNNWVCWLLSAYSNTIIYTHNTIYYLNQKYFLNHLRFKGQHYLLKSHKFPSSQRMIQPTSVEGKQLLNQRPNVHPNPRSEVKSTEVKPTQELFTSTNISTLLASQTAQIIHKTFLRSTSNSDSPT